MITDYSSVFFDFAYMKKPLAYWQFDSERFFAEQYGKGYFKFDEGFGPLCIQKDEVIDFIEDKGLDKDFYLANTVKYICRAGKKNPAALSPPCSS